MRFSQPQLEAITELIRSVDDAASAFIHDGRLTVALAGLKDAQTLRQIADILDAASGPDDMHSVEVSDTDFGEWAESDKGWPAATPRRTK